MRITEKKAMSLSSHILKALREYETTPTSERANQYNTDRRAVRSAIREYDQVHDGTMERKEQESLGNLADRMKEENDRMVENDMNQIMMEMVHEMEGDTVLMPSRISRIMLNTMKSFQ